MSGGTRQRSNVAEDDFSVEWHIIEAMAAAVEAGQGAPIEQRIETVITDVESGTRFERGTIRSPRGKTGEARRFAFVRSVDALMAVGGRGGTQQELALALELDIAVLPVPLFEGAARAVWIAYRDDLVRRLRIDEATAVQWETTNIANADAVAARAGEMVDHFIH